MCAVAEHLQRPLYKLGAGDLGITARSVENCLDRALKLCAHWGAVLLIDEADVFMEQRSANNLQRNELVSGLQHPSAPQVSRADMFQFFFVCSSTTVAS
jgi:hypothetical protein